MGMGQPVCLPTAQQKDRELLLLMSAQNCGGHTEANQETI